jgi:hypothetical protein
MPHVTLTGFARLATAATNAPTSTDASKTLGRSQTPPPLCTMLTRALHRLVSWSSKLWAAEGESDEDGLQHKWAAVACTAC